MSKGICKNRLSLGGLRFGYLKVIGMVGVKNEVTIWECLCDCGRTYKAKGYLLKNGTIKSCGCKSSEMKSISIKIHGDSKTRLYRIWCGMRNRCYNTKNPDYKYYGFKGIKIEFKDFFEFKGWAHENGYKENLTIDRINSGGDYSPNNCRWITINENSSRARKGWKKPITIAEKYLKGRK